MAGARPWRIYEADVTGSDPVAPTVWLEVSGVVDGSSIRTLTVDSSEERAVVRGGKIEIAQMMSVTLSCDHRAIDGALGAELIGAFKSLIENPVMMMV